MPRSVDAANRVKAPMASNAPPIACTPPLNRTSATGSSGIPSVTASGDVTFSALRTFDSGFRNASRPPLTNIGASMLRPMWRTSLMDDSYPRPIPHKRAPRPPTGRGVAPDHHDSTAARPGTIEPVAVVEQPKHAVQDQGPPPGSACILRVENAS